MTTAMTCCKCGEQSYFGDWKWNHFFCQCCIGYTNVVKADCNVFSGSRRGMENE